MDEILRRADAIFELTKKYPPSKEQVALDDYHEKFWHPLGGG
jgi:hypothetical protein